jgi:hypothetical protein
VHRRDVAAHHAAQRNVPPEPQLARDRLLAIEAPRGGPQQIHAAHHPDERAVLVDHREPLEAPVGHDLGDARERRAGVDRHRTRGHDVRRHLGSGRELLEDRVQLGLLQGGEEIDAEPQATLVDEVAVGDDPHRRAPFHHRHRAVDLPEHQLDDLAQRRALRDGGDLARHHVRGGQRPGQVAKRLRLVEDDLRLVDRDEAAGHHLLHAPDESLDHLRAVDPLDDDREILRDVHEMADVDPARRAEPLDATEHRRALRVLPAQELEQRQVRRLPADLVAFVHVDANAATLSDEVHRRTSCASDGARPLAPPVA